MTAALFRDQPPPDSSTESMVRQGVELFGQGRLLEAEFHLVSALAKDQGCFDALQFLAVVRMQQERMPEALDLINRALNQRRRAPEMLALHGTVLSNLGRNEEALVSFDKFLVQQPFHAETLYNRGVALAKLGRTDEAIDSYRDAVSIRPDHALALYNLANTLAKKKEFDEALAIYDRLLASGARPSADVWTNRGNALTELGRYDEALTNYDQALQIDSAQVTTWCNHARALKALVRRKEAVASYDRAIALDPDHVDALTERGGELVELNRAADALASLDAALMCEPGKIDALVHRSGAHYQLKRFDDALADTDIALAIDPQHSHAYFARGNALQGLNRFEPAAEAYHTSLSFGPGIASVHKNLAGALHVLERHDEALFHLDQALMLGERNDEVLANKSLINLSLGRLAEGWEHYDCRLADPTHICRNYPQLRWDGRKLAGTLMVWGEQGLGDQIIYAGMIEELRERAGEVVVEVEPRLADLFARSFPGVRVLPIGKELYAGEIEAHVAIGSLGRHLRPSFESFAHHEHGFLKPDPARADTLRRRLAADGRIVVGLSWKSQNPRYEKAKSARLMDFESILRLPGCRFIDLQYGDTQEEREAVERDLGVRVERLGCVDNTIDIDGLAALMAACDMVATVSNTTAHLAGAVGRPTFVFAPYGHGRLWYWFKGRDDSPWYPRVRVRHQHSGQHWADLIASGTGEITRLLETF